jgi:quercetin 2,3-dioxygenase
MFTKVIRSEERGYFNHGWLKTYHTFSFGDYYNPESMNFGALRVLNDDEIDSGRGFGIHPHSNMEIITIPLKGTLEHEDSTGVKGTIKADEVQVMSAGTGIFHAERNGGSDLVSLFQIWIIPNVRNATPRYEQKKFELSGAIDNNQLLVSENSREGSLKIHQSAYLYRRLVKDVTEFKVAPFDPKNGLFIMVIEGNLSIEENNLKTRDSISIAPEGNSINFVAERGTFLLCIEVPL